MQKNCPKLVKFPLGSHVFNDNKSDTQPNAFLAKPFKSAKIC